MSPSVKNLFVTAHSAMADIPASAWDQCANSANPFVSHAFLSALEDSGSVGPKTGWIAHHTTFANDQGDIEAAAPAYIKMHSYGEYVFDHEWAEAFERAGGAYYPKLQICVPFSPVTGPRLLRRPDSACSLSHLGDAMKKMTTTMNMSSVHMSFCTEDEWDELGQAGWLQRTGIQFHWRNDGYQTFDDFLSALTSSHRKNIRRERRDANAAGLTFQTLRGDDIKASHWDAFYAFYQSTVDRKWGAAYLTRAFFEQISQRMGNQIVLMMAFDCETPVAGALNLVSGHTLYGRNWGCIGQWPFLHFELCYYRAIDFALEHKIERVEAGAQGTHKIQRGYIPERTYSVHFIAHDGLSKGVSHFLDHERKMVEANIQNLNTYSPFRKTA